MNDPENSTRGATGSAPRLPDTLRLGAVHPTVSGLDRSVGFYENSIGLRLHRREDGVAGMGVGGEDLLVLYEEPGARRAGRQAGLYHYALLFPSREELARACGWGLRRRPFRAPQTTARTRRSTFPTPTATASSWPPTVRASGGLGRWTTPAGRIALT
jgi:catechol 2,3-dioxygenase-like lactoylglutathione lyase family enzyme